MRLAQYVPEPLTQEHLHVICVMWTEVRREKPQGSPPHRSLAFESELGAVKRRQGPWVPLGAGCRGGPLASDGWTGPVLGAVLCPHWHVLSARAFFSEATCGPVTLVLKQLPAGHTRGPEHLALARCDSRAGS